MEKTVRCTVCTWRGAWQVAESIPPVRPSQIPPAMAQVQQGIEEHQARNAAVGGRHPPPCPLCGHHTVEAKPHSIRPAT
jgi:hypothetical protein